jgi:hypothetical protein
MFFPFLRLHKRSGKFEFNLFKICTGFCHRSSPDSSDYLRPVFMRSLAYFHCTARPLYSGQLASLHINRMAHLRGDAELCQVIVEAAAVLECATALESPPHHSPHTFSMAASEGKVIA